MGTYYYAVNKENKTTYQLGKGSWYILDREIEALTDEDYLSLFISEDVFNNMEMNYANKIAKELINFIGNTKLSNITIISDNGDDLTTLKAKKYKCVGSRYEGENLDFENRHLQEDYYNKFYKRYYEELILKEIIE